MEFDLSHGRAVLARTPSTLRAMLSDLPADWLHATEGPDTWSPFEVLGHLIHGERADWIDRARIILEQGPDRRFAPFDRLAHRTESEGKALHELLDEFERLRRENLATLDQWELDEKQLSLEGEHPSFGTVSLRQLLAAWVAHDLSHIVQVGRVMAKQYREAVGPWRAYLSVMEH